MKTVVICGSRRFKPEMRGLTKRTENYLTSLLVITESTIEVNSSRAKLKI